jgi:hypothetical protein
LSVATESDLTAVGDLPYSSQGIDLEEESFRQAAVRNYQAFAKGGAKEQDAHFLRMAESGKESGISG